MQLLLACLNFMADKFCPVDRLLGDKLLWTLAIVEYKILVCGISTGRIKEEWLSVKPRYNDLIFQSIADAVWTGLFLENSDPVTPLQTLDSDQLPAFCDTLITRVEEYVEHIAMQYIEK